MERSWNRGNASFAAEESFLETAFRVRLAPKWPRGEIRPDVDAEVFADLLGGPIVMRTLITGRPVTQRLARQIVTLVLDGAAAGPRGRAR